MGVKPTTTPLSPKPRFNSVFISSDRFKDKHTLHTFISDVTKVKGVIACSTESRGVGIEFGGDVNETLIGIRQLLRGHQDFYLTLSTRS